ncbi:MAG TPA: DNA polymerase/3'-5' exonuclease PolX [Chlamydiales bacterium]|nr:DNA polymerase/3'-5' exonuclease PolX [Chlamydiales bacterium]
MDKNEIAATFEEIATLLELKGANPFRIRAYRNAARSLLNSERELDDLIEKKTLTDLPGIGEDLADKISKLAKNQTLTFHEKLKRSIPSGIFKLIQLPGLGPKKVKILHQKLKIQNIDQLKKACLNGQVANLKGFGIKTEKNILDAIAQGETYQKRHLWWDALQNAQPILEALKKQKEVKQAEIAGSLRRKLETIGDIDLIVASAHPEKLMNWFVSQPFIEKILAKGTTKTSVRLKIGMQLDLRIVPASQFAFALCYFTGSKEHNIRIRHRSLKKGWSLSEYGFESTQKGAGRKFKKILNESDLYQSLNLSYIPPELREDAEEIEAAEKRTLPMLLEEKEIRGTFHNHTTASDGRNHLKDMVEGAEKMGWEYIGISDHSKSSVQANGLNEERLMEQVRQIKQINHSQKFKIHIFSGTECDILANGTLDFSDDLLKKLDFVIASVHSSLTQDEKTMTKRMIRAIENPYMTMLGHITGRLLLKREGYKININKVIDACIANKKIIEINGNPNRMEMDWRYWHKAKEKGLLCCINTDAHAVSHHQFFRCGVNIARKGWLEKKNVLNTRPLKEILKYLDH